MGRVGLPFAAAASGAIAKTEMVRARKMGEFKIIAEKAAKLATVNVPPGQVDRLERGAATKLNTESPRPGRAGRQCARCECSVPGMRP